MHSSVLKVSFPRLAVIESPGELVRTVDSETFPRPLQSEALGWGWNRGAWELAFISLTS